MLDNLSVKLCCKNSPNFHVIDGTPSICMSSTVYGEGSYTRSRNMCCFDCLWNILGFPAGLLYEVCCLCQNSLYLCVYPYYKSVCCNHFVILF